MRATVALTICFGGSPLRAQSADWQEVVWREPQVRYLLADMTLGGDPALYRRYAEQERDPDSREAIRRWDAGDRAVNAQDFERTKIAAKFSPGEVTRIVRRGSRQTIAGNEVLLSSDRGAKQGDMRAALLRLALGAPTSAIDRANADQAEALRRWQAGDRVENLAWFELAPGAAGPTFRGSPAPADGALVRLSSDAAYPETNVRYFLADMHLGGSRAFYERVAEAAHEMGCAEAVARYDAGVQITNLDRFERLNLEGKVVIVYRGGTERIRGSDVTLSTD
ncbi:MAG: hypothetical protein U0836_04300 [Pirellulales bacterium]